MSDDFLSSLMADVNEHLAKSKLKSDRDKAKVRANTVTLPAATRRRAAEEFHELSAILDKQEWRPVALVALFNEQECDGCGSVHRVFLQYMTAEALIRKPATQRWVRTAAPDFSLPKETLVQPHKTHICADCCDEHDFYIDDAHRLAKSTECLSPSPSYIQEDINAAAA